MALADIGSWEELAERTPLSRSTLKDLGTVRGRAEETHLRVIAAACDLPYAWFTVADIGRAVEREDEDPTVAERIEALERTGRRARAPRGAAARRRRRAGGGGAWLRRALSRVVGPAAARATRRRRSPDLGLEAVR